MERILLKSKLHRATVTNTDISYEGNIELDPELMKKIDLVEYEKVLVVNINNGLRFETYVIKGSPGSKSISLQGGAARMGEVGDRLIIFSFVHLNNDELENYKPKVIYLDEKNNIIDEKIS